MGRTERYWDWEAAQWEDRARQYSPDMASKFDVTLDSAAFPPAAFPQLIARQQKERQVMFEGKAAYASRQASIRRSLQLTAKQTFTKHIPQLTSGPYRDIAEAPGIVVDRS